MYEAKKQKLDYLIENLNNTLINKYKSAKHEFDLLKNSFIFKNPELIYKDKKNSLKNLIEKLELINPLGVLKRGYSLTTLNEKIVSDIKDISINDNITIRIKNGKIDAKVTDIKEK